MIQRIEASPETIRTQVEALSLDDLMTLLRELAGDDQPGERDHYSRGILNFWAWMKLSAQVGDAEADRIGSEILAAAGVAA